MYIFAHYIENSTRTFEVGKSGAKKQNPGSLESRWAKKVAVMLVKQVRDSKQGGGGILGKLRCQMGSIE